jgi:tetratricopeptide (TPR) repeat protein/Zn-dependent protease with chaperone function
MKLAAFWLLTIALFTLVFPTKTHAQMKERDPKKEEKIWGELQKIAPKSVEKFKAATIALDTQKYDESAKIYREVLKTSPNFEPALRRLSYDLIALGQRDEGLKTAKQAVDLNRSADNLIGYAVGLVSSSYPEYQPTDAEIAEALSLSKEAVKKDTENDPDYLGMVAQLALSSDKINDFNDATKALELKHPDLMQTHYFKAMRLANEGNFSGAEFEIKKAESLGLPHEQAEGLLGSLAKFKTENEQANSFVGYFGLGSYLNWGCLIFGVWGIGLLGLFFGGKILSAKTLKSIENSDPNDITGGGQASLRRLYKNVINFAGFYYYLSQPVVILLVIATTGGIILGFFWIGTIPIKIVVILGFVGLATIFYMLKSFFIRPKMEDPGRVLTENEAPELWNLVREVAKTLDTRSVDEIRITHGSELAVYERGGLRAKMRDKAERILIIGVATLNGFSQNAFRAVLAHEYGHFSNRDTAGGDIAFRVDSDIMNLANSMAMSGTATFYNVAFQFLRLYHFIFRRITHGATRLQEILADRVAVFQYGAEAFREGLTHVIRRDIEFNHVAEKEINDAFGSNRAMQNLYDLAISDENAKNDVDQQFAETLNRATTEDDTHPSPQDRFKLIAQIKSKETLPLSGMVWDFFADRDALTNEMNTMLEQRIKASI